MKPGGVLASIVAPPDEALAKSKGVAAQFVGVRPDGDQLRALTPLVERGALRPSIAKTYPLTEFAAALEASTSGRTRGKLILSP